MSKLREITVYIISLGMVVLGTAFFITLKNLADNLGR